MDELYQSQILSLARMARQSDSIAHPTHQASVKNPVCGDEISLTLSIAGSRIEALHVQVSGCALCEAGAGFLHSHAQGADLTQIKGLSQTLAQFLADKSKDDGDADERLVPFTPIKAVKNRHKCVMLAFSAFDEALTQ